MRILLSAVSLFLPLVTLAAEPALPGFDFVPNQKQWPARVRYSTEVPGGRLFLENSAFTYSLREPLSDHDAHANKPVRGHAFRMQLVGAAKTPRISPEAKRASYQNFFLGNDPQQWAGNVPVFGQLRYQQVYPGIDLVWHTAASGQLEYDYEVAPKANPRLIRMRYEGLDKVELQNGELRLHTSLGTQTEQAPVAYQLNAGGRQEPVACRFVLRNGEVSFELTGSYDPTRKLIIDPSLIFCTYSGTSGGMSANCATSDALGNVYTSGYLISTPYPVTVGAFQTTGRFNNVGISKYSPDGRTLLYSTYMGGRTSNGTEYPLKLVVNAAGEIHLLALTSSSDFPVTPTGFRRTLNGGQDMTVTRFNASGSALLGSTFIGGSSSEAGSLSSVPGAMTLDAAGNVLVGGTTFSMDFPTQSAFQANYGGNSDGFVTKLNPTLSALVWSTFLGGSNNDQVNDLRVAANGSVYVCGQTSSANFPTTPGVINRTLSGTDGFLANISATGNVLQASTLLGSPGFDSGHYLDFNSQGQVCVAGETAGTGYPITGGVYSYTAAPGQSVFLHCLSPNLTSTIFSTRISGLGQNSSGVTTFAIDECDRIMFSAYANAQQVAAPVTSDALYGTTRSIYLSVLGPQASSLIYGSFMGSINAFSTHLHPAAASSINKQGVLTHIECTTARDHPTTPGVYAFTSRAVGNDGAIFRFNLSSNTIADFAARVAPVAPGCSPLPVQFVNNSVGASSYQWDFRDGTTAVTTNPQHTFTNPGTYQVQLIAIRSVACGRPRDTATVTVTVLPKPADELRNVLLGCNQTISLDAGVAAPEYQWSTGERTRTIQGIRAPGVYSVRPIFPGVCPYFIQFTVVRDPSTFPPDEVRTVQLDCAQPLTLDAGVAAPDYEWSTGERTRTIQRVSQPGRYSVRPLFPDGCPYTINFDVVRDPTLLNLPNVITPNKDGLNDFLVLPATVQGSTVAIYNRWGRQVFQSSTYANDWQGEGQAAGIYYYHVTPRTGCLEAPLKGWVEIVR
ncbi:gliding motility-associated C-terminal domain-containing protein [Hymenobacter sp. BT175]|uniref:DUF7948 domain-containing protein n=1 Tax=Hymenobacter translucens TaxID=2886507 RepID=UPI001D0DDA2F|nr:gliding motility-associated C-terminal domain-containing protein [Hymenobacter translucens]MCC2548006.1 gliding motility-associated C-terminal domain-containing protein [Hymenobacter translucens]